MGTIGSTPSSTIGFATGYFSGYDSTSASSDRSAASASPPPPCATSASAAPPHASVVRLHRIATVAPDVGTVGVLQTRVVPGTEVVSDASASCSSLGRVSSGSAMSVPRTTCDWRVDHIVLRHFYARSGGDVPTFEALVEVW